MVALPPLKHEIRPPKWPYPLRLATRPPQELVVFSLLKSAILFTSTNEDISSILDVALDQATPSRISKAWERYRVEEVIGQLSAVLDDELLGAVVDFFKWNGLQ